MRAGEEDPSPPDHVRGRLWASTPEVVMAGRVPGCSQPGPRDGGAADLGDSGAGGG